VQPSIASPSSSSQHFDVPRYPSRYLEDGLESKIVNRNLLPSPLLRKAAQSKIVNRQSKIPSRLSFSSHAWSFNAINPPATSECPPSNTGFGAFAAASVSRLRKPSSIPS